ncbi:MAG: hypothetical protein CLLPBCKN_001761 [Chroococcidiopsis cubana SAG 39.79]|uniref:Uncharacterized protein n=1 Tax=Chroococcidiopsis cubana SAG 39.79 TaxID=388085 RepID=A0AB37UIU3_9CYAN|nr:hypothetical protein [Chroococcidiopsis cubana]MDZ4872373.1 hypothetical protein [Chroococcidiopsis cubana SAG 39.79]PSB42970.1 hypothetical protein C7B80_25675 [Cyanosarcina cf. burmensis CCALA 770]PSB65915.1 hypothetical protein C7B79_03335 [Chroococcidiopsis cubana CCALA 043]RUT11303.1 hypothetical protein DSM107010_34440 [Chroococcidiopsis cubana SAG 39.79]
MKNHFNLKSLAFYGVAISSVLLLFKVVSAYGEANLKAQTSIQGRYLLSLDQNLPDCLELSNLVLDIQQSGIYLNGSLLLAESSSHKARVGEKRPTLTGKLSDRTLQLTGNVPLATICRRPVAAVVNAIAISSQFQSERIEGKLDIGTTAREIAFTAKRLESGESNSRESGVGSRE